MPGWKDKISYDATTPTDGDTIGAFLHTQGGALTSTTISSIEALDVNVANDIAVALDGYYNASTNPTPDHAGVILNTRAASLDDTTQTVRLTGGVASSDNVVAANVSGQDVNAFGMAFDGSTWDRILKDGTSNGLLVHLAGSGIGLDVQGNVADDAADSGDPVKVGSRAVDSALSELSAANDRADLISDLYRRIYINDSANIALGYGNSSVTDTAAVVVAANSGRRRILVQNLGSKDIYLGGNASVVTTTGFRVGKDSAIELLLGEHVPLYAIAASGTNDVRYLQLA